MHVQTASLASSSSSKFVASRASVNWQRAAFNRSNSRPSIASFRWEPSSYYASSIERRELDFELEMQIDIHYDSLKIQKSGDWQTYEHGTSQYKRTTNPRYIAESMGLRDRFTYIKIAYHGPHAPLEPLLLATNDSTRFMAELDRLPSKLSRGAGHLERTVASLASVTASAASTHIWDEH